VRRPRETKISYGRPVRPERSFADRDCHRLFRSAHAAARFPTSSLKQRTETSPDRWADGRRRCAVGRRLERAWLTGGDISSAGVRGETFSFSSEKGGSAEEQPEISRRIGADSCHRRALTGAVRCVVFRRPLPALGLNPALFKQKYEPGDEFRAGACRQMRLPANPGKAAEGVSHRTVIVGRPLFLKTAPAGHL